MKNLIFLFCATLFSLHAHGQTGFYIQPQFGIGVSNAIEKQLSQTNTYYTIRSTQEQIKIGYQYHHWRFTSGIGYLRTGFLDEYISSHYAINEPTRFVAYYHHVTVPLSAGYQFSVTRKLSVVPALGAELYYNLGQKNTVTSFPDYTLSGSDFTKYNQRISLAGMADVHAEYALSSKLSVLAGPSAHVMLTNIYKNDLPTATTQHNNAYLFDMGIIWHFRQANKPARKTTNKADR